MNILLVGSGGREHALAWKILQSPLLSRLVCAPGNPGIAGLCQTRPVKADDIDALVALAREIPADLVVIGPDATIAAGLADRLAESGIACFGPTAAAGRLESSKAFAKAFAERHGLPAGRFAVFDDAGAAKAALGDYTAPYVIKADGLAAGKGVVIAPDRPTAEAAIDGILGGRFGAAGSRVLIEEFLVGEVVSVFALCDGETVVMLGGAQDHKPAFDGDQGPNTGGMGAYAPAPALNPAMLEQVRARLIAPALAGIALEGAPYRGVLFCETMITANGPRLIEFNARFGDPETQVLMLAMKSDLVPYLAAAARGGLADAPAVEWDDAAVICVVVAAAGYPGPPATGDAIEGAEDDYGPDVTVFQAGTARREDGALVSAGGRVLNICARGATLAEAAARAYDVVGRIRVEGAFHRSDIGWRGLAAERALAIHSPSG
jgi:phosphoribosylamine--glycine ligase